ncbi:hypothetical protein AGR2A_Lc40020 [Agrobacterium genomosp. 2 str. CFBP 5494]|uniref:Uncharacterized protein n=1 Tax=Agrobacterium genomosp. 2 str. CFBP 5494 TaxID=1183436 RepID=A0A9W5B4W3_9HYPH|nr:hypothetical protein AGR2A_Lc40020 [Agrobacterium genomosp. 2 str. CFBP 5494]
MFVGAGANRSDLNDRFDRDAMERRHDSARQRWPSRPSTVKAHSTVNGSIRANRAGIAEVFVSMAEIVPTCQRSPSQAVARQDVTASATAPLGCQEPS